MYELEDQCGIWREGEHEINNIASNYFTEIFLTRNTAAIHEIMDCVTKHVTVAHKEMLDKMVTYG